MPKKQTISREDVLAAALDVIREFGPQGLGARAVARRLGSSTQPIFSHFESMAELERATLKQAEALYWEMTVSKMKSAERSYRASGLAYIAFAREEPALFRWLFMRDRRAEPPEDDRQTEWIVSTLETSLRLTHEDALLFHLEMWTVCHGIATMTATAYWSWNDDLIARVFTDFYYGLQTRYQKKGEVTGNECH